LAQGSSHLPRLLVMLIWYCVHVFLSLAAAPLAAAPAAAEAASPAAAVAPNIYEEKSNLYPCGTCLSSGPNLLQVATAVRRIHVDSVHLDGATLTATSGDEKGNVATVDAQGEARATADAPSEAAAVDAAAAIAAAAKLLVNAASAFASAINASVAPKHSASRDPGNVDCNGRTPEDAAVIGCHRHSASLFETLKETVAVVHWTWLAMVGVVAVAAGVGLIMLESRGNQRGRRGPNEGYWDGHGYQASPFAGYGTTPQYGPPSPGYGTQFGPEPWPPYEKDGPDAWEYHDRRTARLNRGFSCC